MNLRGVPIREIRRYRREVTYGKLIRQLPCSTVAIEARRRMKRREEEKEDINMAIDSIMEIIAQGRVK